MRRYLGIAAVVAVMGVSTVGFALADDKSDEGVTCPEAQKVYEDAGYEAEFFLPPCPTAEEAQANLDSAAAAEEDVRAQKAAAEAPLYALLDSLKRGGTTKANLDSDQVIRVLEEILDKRDYDEGSEAEWIRVGEKLREAGDLPPAGASSSTEGDEVK